MACTLIPLKNSEISPSRRPRRQRTLAQPGRYSAFRSNAAALRPIPRKASRDFARRWLRQGFLVALLSYAQLLFMFSNTLKVQSFWVAGNHRLETAAIVQQSGLATGSFLWSHSPAQIATRIEKLHEIKDVHVRYGLPGRVEIELTERQPLFQIASSGKRPQWFAVDAEGVVLRPIQELNPTLPRLLLEQPVKPGDHIHLSNLFTVASAAEKIEHSMPGKVWYYRLDARGGLSFRSFSHHRTLDVEIGSLDNLKHKMQILLALIDHVIGDQQVASIDLRYSSPTVRYVQLPGAKTEAKTNKPS